MKYNNQFLFSETYINKLVSGISKEKKNDDHFENILSWYEEYKSDWLLFEDITLDTLGFLKNVDGDFRILTSDTDEKVAVAYLLPGDCDLNTIRKGRYYAVKAVSKARSLGVEWAFITNGYEWRLYHTTEISPYEFYFAVNISEELKSGSSSETTRAFCKLFSAESFQHTENQLIMDMMKEESNIVAESIEDILRSKAEDILKDLCYGLKENMRRVVFSNEDRKKIYNDAIILLYRLLFLGYAEARNMLPVTENDPEYEDSYSDLCETAREYYISGHANQVENDFDLWERLDSQLRIYVDKYYNGGLFSNEDKPILREYRIANKHLMGCLLELSYIKGKNIDYDIKIEYKDLSVRNLGAIYEGLLEYQLFIAEERMVQRKSKNKVTYYKAADVKLVNSDSKNLINPGEIYLSQDALERKETGAYYTPEDVVEYIINQTVGKKLVELKEEIQKEVLVLKDELEYEPVEQNCILIQREIDERIIKFIDEKVLSLTIIDSAMGSGHFLVNASYKISNFIIELLEENNWENEVVNIDIGYWKRRVVENCIYGIDINELSVLLSRLSLWLISASNDKALSFIDHHLKCGNSIIGTSVEKVQNYDERHPILNVTYEAYMSGILSKYAKMKEIGSNTKSDVDNQHNLYNEIEYELSVVKRKLDYYLASQYAGGISDKVEYYNVLSSTDIEEFEDLKYQALWSLADNNKFFHWQIEFPEVFIREGFDIAIGNPPYVDVSSETYTSLGLVTIDTKNLYSYMIETTSKYTKYNGMVGYIIPLSGFYTPRMKPFYEYLTKEYSIFLSNYGIRPSKIFKKAEQRTSIFYGVRGNTEKIVYTTSYKRWYSSDRHKLFSDVSYVKQLLDNEFEVVPKIGCDIERNILSKVYKTEKRIVNYEKKDSENIVYFHGAARYWLKALDFLPSFYNEKKGNGRSSEWKEIHFNEEIDKNVIICLLNSSLFFWYWILMSDERHFSKGDILKFPFDYEQFSPLAVQFDSLAIQLMKSYKENSIEKEIRISQGITRYQEFYPKLSKNLLNEIDKLVGKAMGLQEDEVFYIINKDLKIRVGEEGDNE